MDRTDMEIQAKLQVKIGRTLLRAKLIMLGNALLVAWLVSTVLAAVWYLAYVQTGPSSLTTMVALKFGLTVLQFQKLNGIGIVTWKMVSGLLLLCPGIGLRVCGDAMKP